MKRNASILAAGASLGMTTVIVFAGLTNLTQPGWSQPAPGERGFWCDSSSGKPITMYQTANGTQEPWINWESSFFQEAGYTPQRRCREVSGRLNTYLREKKLKFITAGVMNRQRVLCTASVMDGPCERLVYTLKPGQDAVRTLNNLLSWKEGQAGVVSLSESSGIPYIDVSQRLGR